MKQSITIDIDVKDGYELKFNPETMKVEQVEKAHKGSRSWKEFCENHPRTQYEFYFTGNSTICQVGPTNTQPLRRTDRDRNLLATSEDAEGILAFIQLVRLYEEWSENWDLSTIGGAYQITKREGDLCLISTSLPERHLFIFPTVSLAEEFLVCFKDLFETAKKFIV